MSITEKVHCVYDYWDMAILSGVADHLSKPCYFSTITPDGGTEWFSDRYNLTILSGPIVSQIFANWHYWLAWRKQSQIVHPATYKEWRRESSVEVIVEKNRQLDRNQWLLLEDYHQREIEIANYLERVQPHYERRGIFQGDIDGTNTVVEWCD